MIHMCEKVIIISLLLIAKCPKKKGNRNKKKAEIFATDLLKICFVT